jgi:hypothetical protein
VVIGADETVILDCYRLARWYHQNPEVFLAMTEGEVRLHIRRTKQLADILERESTPRDA